jgi:hypothetical protein
VGGSVTASWFPSLPSGYRPVVVGFQSISPLDRFRYGPLLALPSVARRDVLSQVRAGSLIADTSSRGVAVAYARRRIRQNRAIAVAIAALFIAAAVTAIATKTVETALICLVALLLGYSTSREWRIAARFLRRNAEAGG